MSDDKIIAQINDALAEEFEFERADMTPESHLIDDLELDSLDFVDLVVHVFDAERRMFYNLERLWADAPIAEVTDDTANVELLQQDVSS